MISIRPLEIRRYEALFFMRVCQSACARLARQSQVDANTLTWALYDVVQRAPGEATGQGRFASITAIARIDTTGGMPPNPRCTHEGLRLLMHYSATYLMYRMSADSALSEPALQKTMAPTKTEFRVRTD